MPILPLIDLLIFAGWTSLMVGFAQKAFWVGIRRDPSIFGLQPLDFLGISAICLVFAVALAARTWVKLNEPRLMAMRRDLAAAEARRRVQALDGSNGNGQAADVSPLRAEVGER